MKRKKAINHTVTSSATTALSSSDHKKYCTLLHSSTLSGAHKKKWQQFFEAMEDQLQQKNAELIKVNEQLHSLLMDKDNFMGIASHDLQHPLVAITMVSKLLIQKYPATDMQANRMHHMIHDAAMEMQFLIKNYLDITRYESGGLKLKLSKENICKLTNNVVQRYKEIARKKGIMLHFVAADNYYLKTDKHCFIQILENLISNAIKFTPHNKNVYVKVSQEKNETIVEVHDEGIGIKKKEMPLLFEKFQQLSSRPTGGELSTGLGLNIAKFLLDKMGGSVQVVSVWKKGSLFRLRF